MFRKATSARVRAARITQDIFYAKTPWATPHPSTLSHPCPPTPRPSLDSPPKYRGMTTVCLVGGFAPPPLTHSRSPSVFWWRIWAGPGGGGAWVTERRWVRGCPGCLCVKIFLRNPCRSKLPHAQSLGDDHAVRLSIGVSRK